MLTCPPMIETRARGAARGCPDGATAAFADEARPLSAETHSMHISAGFIA
jgi:hypothetical protein